MLHALISIAGGIKKFYTGAGATMARDVPGSMAWFGAYEVAKMSICEGVCVCVYL